MGRLALVLTIVLALIAIQPQAATAQLLSTHQLTTGSESLAQQALEKLEDPEKVEMLEAYGISKEEARQRVAGLSDAEIQKVLNGEYTEAGGDSILVIGLLVIIIILLVR